MKRFFIFMICLVLAGCQTWTPVKEDGMTYGPKKAYMMKLPDNWMRAGTIYDRVVVTRDGISIQYIEAKRLSPDDAFEKIEEKPESNMLPEKLAELTLAELRAEDLIAANLQVLDNRPVQVAGHDAFRLHVQYKSPKGLRIERVIYGLLDGEHVVFISYQAPTIHFFERDLEAFEKTVKSFQLST